MLRGAPAGSVGVHIDAWTRCRGNTSDDNNAQRFAVLVQCWCWRMSLKEGSKAAEKRRASVQCIILHIHAERSMSLRTRQLALSSLQLEENKFLHMHDNPCC